MSTTYSQDLAPTWGKLNARRLLWLDGGLIVGAVAAAVIARAAAAVAAPVATTQPADPALARLLLGMAFVKLAFVVAMAALSVWRFRRPLGLRLAVGYQACVWMAVAATVLIWQSAWLGAASVLFHGAGLAFMVLAMRDDRVLPAALRRG